MNKVCIILRGTSSCGKSTFASYLSSLKDGAVVCCADDYFEKTGEYIFDRTKLGHAHNECFDKFLSAIMTDVEMVIVANTSTTEKELSRYSEMALECGYTIFYTVLEKRHEGTNSHGCPDFTIQRQDQNLRNSLKLS